MSTYAAIRSYTINPAYLDEDVDIGMGIDMRDPQVPTVAPRAAFAHSRQQEGGEGSSRFGLATSTEGIHETFRYETTSSVAEEELIIAENFKASYGLNRASEAAGHAQKEKRENYTTYALLEHRGESQRLESGARFWAEAPFAGWSGDDPAALRERFFDAYGTHYVSQVKFGLRIAIQAKMRRTDTHTSDELKVSFKAAMGGVGAAGGISVDKQKALEKMGVEIRCETTTGGLAGHLLTPLTSLEAIDEYLRALRTGTTEYSVSPISLSLKDYLPTLEPTWAIYQALKVTVPPPPELEYGVPLGTVVPWSPPSRYVEGLQPQGSQEGAAGAVRITPPVGWVICDGTAGTPDLRERFVLGIRETTWRGYPTIGGSREKATLVTGGGPVGDPLPRGGGTDFHPSNYGHTHTVELPEPQWPPFVGLLYIMRVA